MKRKKNPKSGHEEADMSQYHPVVENDKVKYFVKPGISARLTFKTQELLDAYLEEHPEFDKKAYKEINMLRNIYKLFVNLRAMNKQDAAATEKKFVKEMEKIKGE